MKKGITKVCYSTVWFALMALPFVAGANPTSTPSTGLKNPLRVTSIEALIAAVIEIVVKVGAPLIVLFIIYSGFLFVKAQGNEEKLKEAKKALAWTVVGAAILLGAWLIAEVIQNTITNLRG